MALAVRLVLFLLGLLAVFWLLALVVGWLWYVIIGVGVVALIALVVWALTRGKASPTPRLPLTQKHERLAQKELQRLEQRQKNGPQ